MYVRAGRPAFARPCVGIHKSTSLMSSSLLLQQCPACLVRLTWIDFVIGGRWPYSWCLVGCRCQDLLRNSCVPSSFFSSRFVSVHVVHPYSSIDVTAAWKKLRFILSVRSDFHIVDSLLIAVHAFVNLVSMSFSVDSTLLPRYVTTSLTNVPRLVIAHIFRFVCTWRQGYAEVFRLGQVICQYRYVIKQISKAILFDFVNRIRTTNDKEIQPACPLVVSCYNVEVFCVSIWWSYFYFSVSIITNIIKAIKIQCSFYVLVCVCICRCLPPDRTWHKVKSPKAECACVCV